MQRDLDRLLRDARAALGDPGGEREDRAVARALAARRARLGRRLGLVAALALAAMALSFGAVAAVVVPERTPTAAEAGPSVRVVDRTFSCMPARSYEAAGARGFAVAVTKRTMTTVPPRHWEPASVVVQTSPASARAKLLIVRGHESRYALRTPGLDGPGGAGVYLNTTSCVASRKAVPLSSRGLPGPAVRYETATGCLAPGRILVRVRARLAAPARWRQLGPLFSGVQRNVTDMAVAVRAERTGAPLVFAQADAKTTALWRADGCR